MRAMLLMTLPLLALAACNKTPDASATDAATATPTAAMAAGTATAMATPAAAMAAPDAATYIAKAGAGDMFEIESSRAIIGKTKSPDVSQFAAKMVAAHKESTAMVKAAAMKAGMTPKPPMLDADQQAMLDKIKAATGTDADALYMADQKTGHDAALALHSAYADGGDTPALKAVAAKIVPVVKSHIAMLDKMPKM